MADNEVELAQVRTWLMTVTEKPAPPLNLDELLHAGHRHRRRRRIVEGLSAAAAVALIAGGAFAVLGGSHGTHHDVMHDGPTSSAVQTTPAAQPLSVPGYTYGPPTLAQLDGFDLQRSVTANETVSGGVGIRAAAINQVFKSGQPEQILLLQYEFKWPWWSGRGLGSDLATEMTTMPISEGFANPTRGVVVKTVHVAGKPTSHFEAGTTFYAWADQRGVILVSGRDHDATRAFVAAYITAQRHQP